MNANFLSQSLGSAVNTLAVQLEHRQDPKDLPPLIAFAPHPWDDGPWMNRQNLLAGLAKLGWKIVYSDGPLDLWSRRGAAWKRASLLGHCESLNGVTLYRSGRLVPRWRTSRKWDAFALRHHAMALRRSANIERTDAVIAVAFHPGFQPLIDALNPSHVAFHVYDVYAQMETWTSCDQLEFERLVGRADLLTASTEAMIRSLPPSSQGMAKLLPNGADVSLFRFAPSNCPPDLSRVPHPRISNLGTINRKMDLALIAAVAQRRPDWHWVLVGKLAESELMADAEAREGLIACRKQPNVHFMGEKPRLEVAAYMHHMDVNTVCYRIRPGEWVSAGYPVKLNEYLAVGKPVVASPQEAIVKHFSNVVDVASGEEQWITAIDAALKGEGVGTPESRIATATSNDWSVRVSQLDAWLRQLLHSPQVERALT